MKKIPAWQLTKVKNKNEVVDEARNQGITVRLASSMNLCHLKISELEPQFPKYKGRVVLRGDTVKHDPVSYAAFTEQGSSASQITAAKVMDIISRLPGCAADAVSPYTPGQKGRCTDVIENYEVRMSRYLATSTKTQMAEIMVQHGRPSRSSRAKSVRSSSGRTIMGKAIRESSIVTRLGKSSKLGMLVCKPRRRTILVSVCGRSHTGWEERNIDRMWKVLVKEIDVAEPTSFLDHVYLVALNENAKLARTLWTI